MTRTRTGRLEIILVGAAIAAAALIAARTLAESVGQIAGSGPMTSHMLMHIALMNIAAPFAGMCAAEICQRSFRAGQLALFSFLQIILLWGWHAPVAMQIAHDTDVGMMAMHISLYAAAVLFWSAVFGTGREARWMSIFAVLVTGKLFCLLAVLIALAPRVIYPNAHAAHVGQPDSVAVHALADQQLAGMIMIVACPLTYVLAGVVIASRWLFDIERSRQLDIPAASAE